MSSGQGRGTKCNTSRSCIKQRVTSYMSHCKADARKKGHMVLYTEIGNRKQKKKKSNGLGCTRGTLDATTGAVGKWVRARMQMG